MPHLAKPIYEGLPWLYATLGAALLWWSYSGRDAWWSTPCALAAMALLVIALVVWMRRRDYRATSGDYLRRGHPVLEPRDKPEAAGRRQH